MDSERKEFDAFLNFFATFKLARPVTAVADLSDGAALFEVLSIVCADLISGVICSSMLISHPVMQSTFALLVPACRFRRTGYYGLAH